MFNREYSGKRNMIRAAAAGIAAAVMLAGCGSSGTSAGKSAAYEEATASYDYDYEGDYALAAAAPYESDALYDSAGAYEYEAEEYKEVPESGGGETQAQTPQDTSRKLITSMHISAETEEMDALLAHIDGRVTALGGYIEYSDVSNTSTKYVDGKRKQYRSASLTLRIPANRLSEFVNDFQERSNITSQSKNVEDVTLSYADVESHKRMLQKEEERLLDFMEQAETIEDMLTVEERLTNVQYQLDSLESQLRTYDNKINYSTLTLSIEEVVEFTVIEEEPPTFWEEITEGFMDSLESVGNGFKSFFAWFVIHIPQLLVWGVIIFIIVKIVLHFRKKKAEALAEEIRNGTHVPTPREQNRMRKMAEKEAKRLAKQQKNAAKKGQSVPPQQAPGQQVPQPQVPQQPQAPAPAQNTDPQGNAPADGNGDSNGI